MSIKLFASDVPAFLEQTDNVVYLEDGDMLRVGAGEYHITDIAGTSADRPVDKPRNLAKSVTVE